MLDETPFGLKRLEADWRDWRRAKIEASLTRRATYKSPKIPTEVEIETTPVTAGDPSSVTASESGPGVEHSPAYSVMSPGKETSFRDPTQKVVPTGAERSTCPLTSGFPGQPNERATKPRHMRSCRRQLGAEQCPVNAHAHGVQLSKPEPLLSGALPPGTYPLRRRTGALLVHPSPHVGSPNLDFAMTFLLDTSQYDISSNGRSCSISNYRSRTRERSLLVLSLTGDWTREDGEVWEHLRTTLAQVKKHIDQVSWSVAHIYGWIG